ncbi:hypothetical protein SETIT_6G024900v2 [Setaria italica]|uniref:Uncharacterized protein n=1 Tax=Setaria italica TaxID=4555 RepID=A0A368RHA9_SETIT|nr:hypothetical protein SETIT_6G024900v2 [Setaria italica]
MYAGDLAACAVPSLLLCLLPPRSLPAGHGALSLLPAASHRPQARCAKPLPPWWPPSLHSSPAPDVCLQEAPDLLGEALELKRRESVEAAAAREEEEREGQRVSVENRQVMGIDAISYNQTIHIYKETTLGL